MTTTYASDKKVTCLGEFVDRVRCLRALWTHPSHMELWYRGESKKYEAFLSPELYRPHSGHSPTFIKPIPELIRIEYELYEAFQRGAVQLSSERQEDENWDWDSYFLMQHHNAPTRLLDWSDGALIALHFAVRHRTHDDHDAVVYVLEPDRLNDQLKGLAETEITKTAWKEYVKNHRSEDFSEDEWERCYLPRDKESQLSIPAAPLFLEFPHITRRVAAQRSRFMVFGTSYMWLAKKFKDPDFPMKQIIVDSSSKAAIRTELRDNGITESVVFPDLDGLGREMKQLWEERKMKVE